VILDPGDLEKYRIKLRYKIYYHLGSSCPEVEDIVQETMVRFLSALQSEKMRNPESLAAFLSGICNNVIHEYKRRMWREPVSDPDLAPSMDPADIEVDWAELRQAIGLVMVQLSSRDREILRAFYLEEKDKSEICRVTGLTEAQFRVALFRAKERFREIYQQSMKRKAAEQH
jgi:RNA polymerase sigma-70 factor (ECF subfamily)